MVKILHEYLKLIIKFKHINVNYYEDDNDTNKFTFETKLADSYITSLIAKRIFREAEINLVRE
jgi:hypothetical protein